MVCGDVAVQGLREMEQGIPVGKVRKAVGTQTSRFKIITKGWIT